MPFANLKIHALLPRKFITYNHLFASRKPEMRDSRSANVDLTVESRRRTMLALLGLSIVEGNDEDMVIDTLRFALNSVFFDVDAKVQQSMLECTITLVGRLSSSQHIDLANNTIQNFLSSRIEGSAELVDKVRTFAVILQSKWRKNLCRMIQGGPCYYHLCTIHYLLRVNQYKSGS